jgi:hypothetical protein
MRALTSIAEDGADHSVVPLRPRQSQDCEKLLAVDRVVRCMVRARAELTACTRTDSDADIDFWIAQLRTARVVFRRRLIAYLDHYQDCAACQAKSEPVVFRLSLPKTPAGQSNLVRPIGAN